MFIQLKNIVFSFVLVERGHSMPCLVNFSPLEDGSYETEVLVAGQQIAVFSYAGAISTAVAKELLIAGFRKWTEIPTDQPPG